MLAFVVAFAFVAVCWICDPAFNLEVTWSSCPASASAPPAAAASDNGTTAARSRKVRPRKADDELSNRSTHVISFTSVSMAGLVSALLDNTIALALDAPSAPLAFSSFAYGTARAAAAGSDDVSKRRGRCNASEPDNPPSKRASNRNVGGSLSNRQQTR